MEARPLIFPAPQQLQLRETWHGVDADTRLLLPLEPTPEELFLARSLMAELVDRHQLALSTQRVARLPASGRFIVMGRRDSPLVRQALAARKLHAFGDDPDPGGVVQHAPGDPVGGGDPGIPPTVGGFSVNGVSPPADVDSALREAYVLDIDARGVVIAGGGDVGAFYGLQSLRQLLTTRPDGTLTVPGIHVSDYPRMGVRALRLYLPGRDNFAFFKRLVRDFAAYFKYNTLVLEVNAAMRLERHPELNAGWIEFGRCLNETRRSRPEGPGRQFQDSAHHDTGDFAIIEKEEVAELVAFARQQHMDVIPEIPSLTHTYYLLTRHRELAEIQAAEWPDTYCPLEPGARALYFDVLDEYLEVMTPRTVHIGRDEWRMPMGVCPRCREHDHRDLWVEDVVQIHAHLAARGIRTAMWGDHLLESVRGSGGRDTRSPGGYAYRMPGGLRPQQVVERIPKDILVLNWFWNTAKDGNRDASGEQLRKWGFQQVYGNFTPEIAEQDYPRRSAREGVLGGAVSSWAQTSEAVLGKDLMYPFVGCASLLWSSHWPACAQLTEIVQALMPAVRRNLHGAATPLESGGRVRPLDISSARNSRLSMDAGAPTDLIHGTLARGRFRFELPTPTDDRVCVRVDTRGSAGRTGPPVSRAMPVGRDVSGLLFLHACEYPAGNAQGHFQIYNFADTADLLGWYEIVYADGLVQSVPVRYGVNILEEAWGRQHRADAVCYAAEPVDCASAGTAPVTFFAHEWINPRYGKVISHVRLRGSSGFVDAHGRPIADNAIRLLALSVVEARSGPQSEYMGEDF